MSEIGEEIKQKKFVDEFAKAEINLMFTANWRMSQIKEIVKPFDVSIQQFNIMRILKGQFPKPAPLKLLTERMLDKMSNTSRLVEKLYNKELVKRESCEMNRRQVDIVITQKGIDLCDEISQHIEGSRTINTKITEQEGIELNRILDKIRS